MVFNILITLILVLFKINFLFSEIIYDKKNITITNLELNNYQLIYERTYGEEVTTNQAIKNIVLMNQTINFYQRNNPSILELIDKKINNNLKDINLNFYRFMIIKNEFLIEYFKTNFNKKDLEDVFNLFENINLPISLNGCKTISSLEDLKNNLFFIENFYTNLINGTKKFKTNIDSKIYDVCINDQNFKILENKIISYLENISKEDFNSFIYEKLI